MKFELFQKPKEEKLEEDPAQDLANLMLAKLDSDEEKPKQVSSEDYTKALHAIERLKILREGGYSWERIKAEMAKLPTRVRYFVAEKMGAKVFLGLENLSAADEADGILDYLQTSADQMIANSFEDAISAPDQGFEHTIGENVVVFTHLLKNLPRIVDRDDPSIQRTLSTIHGDEETFDGHLLVVAEFNLYIDKSKGRIYGLEPARHVNSRLEEHPQQIEVARVRIGVKKNPSSKVEKKVFITGIKFEDEYERDEDAEGESWERGRQAPIPLEAKGRIFESIKRWNSFQEL